MLLMLQIGPISFGIDFLPDLIIGSVVIVIHFLILKALFKAHPVVMSTRSDLTEYVEQYMKISNEVLGQNVKNLYIKVSQKRFQQVK